MNWSKQDSFIKAPETLQKLNAGSETFLAAFSEQTTVEPKGYMLILHGNRQHPDWADVIKPLRTRLPDYGWTTLSIELPLADKEAKEKDYLSLLDKSAARILAAQSFLQSKESGDIIVIAYGLGARMAVDWLSKTPQPPVSALIIISMAGGAKDSGLDSNTDLQKVNVPILDIYAENDTTNVLKAVKDRRKHRSKILDFRQIEIIAADQFYKYQEDEIIKRIRGWLKVTFKTKKPQE
ncbi:MAG: DUF3530 family protein [Gammaproteobacteria bacterium]|nr:DUF3530 family protein [Gammaproteobacteria bacterium]